MDWGRAKTVLIISFLLLNLLLGYQLWTSNQDFAATKGGGIGASEMVQLLNSKGVVMEAVVPAETPSLREIAVRFQDQAQAVRQEMLKEPVRDDLKLISGSALPARIARQIEGKGSYVLDVALSRKGSYVYNQTYRGLPMFEVRLELLAEKDVLVQVRQHLAEVLAGASGDAKEQRVLSAMTAVGAVVENYLGSGAVITDIRLGYHGQLYNSETQVLAPFWRIMLRSGELYYVHAINGAVEVPQKGK